MDRPPHDATRIGLTLLAAASLVACRPTRTLVLDSVPPGAIVRLDERVIGRTPLEYEFQHYGRRRLSMYSPGYRTHSERLELDPPWHAEFPWDLFTEVLLPLGLDHRVDHPVVMLEPDDGVEALPGDTEFLERATQVREAARRVGAGRSGAPAVDDDEPDGAPASGNE